MKAKLLTLSLIYFFFSGIITAQTKTVSSGVYLTIDDYKNNRLIEEADCKNDKEKFKKHDYFSKQEFVVIRNGVKITYLKKGIYAYRDCENRVWRFYNDKEYEILETKDIYIYKIGKVVLNGMTVEKDPVYFFSDGAGGQIKELSVDNLKLAYPENQKFHIILETEFNSKKEDNNPDKLVHSFDSKHKMYKVNYLFIQSKK